MIDRLKQHKLLIGLLLLWLGVQLFLFSLHRDSHGGDTERYLGAANQILHGILPTGTASAYIGYDLFVSLIFSLHLGETGILVSQILLALLAAISLYFITYNLNKNRSTAVLSVIFYITSLELQAWNFYILTESLTFSMTLISFYLISRIKEWRQFFYILPVIFFTSFIRPTNFILLISFTLFIIVSLWERKKYKIVYTTVGIFTLLLPLLLVVINQMAAQQGIIDNYTHGTIIWGYKENALTPPDDLILNNYGKNYLWGMVLFMWENLGYMLHLAILKLFFFFAHVKPFYSTAHNLLIAATFYPIYLLSLIGLFVKKVHRPTQILLLTYLVGQTLIVMLTFEDWDGRFLHAVMPVIYILAALGGVKLFDYLKTFFLELIKDGYTLRM